MVCTHYTGRERCYRTATLRLYSPDGSAVPGCTYCDEHGRAPIDEYREKLGEVWTAAPIDEYGREIAAPREG